MIRLLFKLGSIFTLLFAVCIALIRAQPYDDSELRAFLTPPEGCPAPCFIGIRPGVTRLGEAIELLRNHEWVKQLHVQDTTPRSVIWEWSGSQPSIIDEDSNGFLTARYQDGLVERISIGTTVPVGYMYLIFGKTYFTDSFQERIDGEIFVSAVYFDHYLLVSTTIDSCPVTYMRFWNAPMRFELSSTLRSMSGFSHINFACR